MPSVRVATELSPNLGSKCVNREIYKESDHWEEGEECSQPAIYTAQSESTIHCRIRLQIYTYFQPFVQINFNCQSFTDTLGQNCNSLPTSVKARTEFSWGPLTSHAKISRYCNEVWCRQRWAIVSTIDHYRSKFLLSLSIVLTFEKTIVIDSRKTCKNHV